MNRGLTLVNRHVKNLEMKPQNKLNDQETNTGGEGHPAAEEMCLRVHLVLNKDSESSTGLKTNKHTKITKPEIFMS